MSDPVELAAGRDRGADRSRRGLGDAALPLADADRAARLEPVTVSCWPMVRPSCASAALATTPPSREVVRGGPVRSRQGVSVPAERMAADALDRADEAVIPHLLEVMPDFAGQSFVRSAADVRLLRSRIPDDIRIVAKIETRPALEDIDEILEVADGIMVARGDLGVELPFEQVPLAQKDLVRAALMAGKPSIVATQMLESMVKAPRPTRAEASDVANAIIDGADAVMLSGETAVGAWPLEAAARHGRHRPAHGRLQGAHATARRARPRSDRTSMRERWRSPRSPWPTPTPTWSALACYTHSGRTPRRLSSLRPGVPIAAFTPTEPIARSLTLRARGLPHRHAGGAGGARCPSARPSSSALGQGKGELGLRDDDAVVLVQTSVRGGPNALELLRP